MKLKKIKNKKTKVKGMKIEIITQIKLNKMLRDKIKKIKKKLRIK
jgi:hypothetical protein